MIVPVSIHAPTKGATAKSVKISRRQGVSIHAPTKGATTIYSPQSPTSFSFNPRTHEGCDHPRLQSVQWEPSFNPRTHEGCDTSYHYYEIALLVFQSTHPRRVRLQIFFSVFVNFSVSIHAPTKGATDNFWNE